MFFLYDVVVSTVAVAWLCCCNSLSVHTKVTKSVPSIIICISSNFKKHDHQETKNVTMPVAVAMPCNSVSMFNAFGNGFAMHQQNQTINNSIPLHDTA